MSPSFDQRLARRLDVTMRELIFALLHAGHRLTPEVIERLRGIVLEGFVESARVTLQRDAELRRQHAEVPGPWDDEPTQPERPSAKPPRNPNGEH